MPIVFIYCLHFFQHDESLKPTGFITAEHATYMVYAKQYSTGEASLFFGIHFSLMLHHPGFFSNLKHYCLDIFGSGLIFLQDCC